MAGNRLACALATVLRGSAIPYGYTVTLPSGVDWPLGAFVATSVYLLGTTFELLTATWRRP